MQESDNDNKNVIDKQNEKKNVLVICAHSDDQILGPGGTMAKYAREGYDVHTIIFSYGEVSHPHLKLGSIAKIRVKESKEADNIIGGKGVIFLAIKDGQMKQDFTNRKMMPKLKNLILKHNPDKIFTHSSDDMLPDHRFVRKIVLEAYDSLHKQKKVFSDVYSFDVWNIWNFKKRKEPYLVVDISKTFKYKIRALHTFKSQINFFSFTYLVNILYISVYVKAIMNGLKNGCKLAEVFYKIR